MPSPSRLSFLHRRRVAVAAAGLVATLLLSLLAAAPAGASGEASDFVSRINSLRASVGAQPLQVDGELTAGAEAWAGHLAATGSLAHDPNLQRSVTQAWTKLAENVGMGSDVPSVFGAFLASSTHYRNMVDPAFNRVGVGVAYGGGHLWTCHRFMAVGGGAATASVGSSAPAPKRSTPRPAPTTSTTALAPAPAPAPPPPPPPPPTGPPSGDPTRVATVLSALRQLSA